MNNFVPLHCHDYYSLLDGLSSPTQVAKRCKSLGYNSCAITNHGSLSSCVEFMDACNKQQVKPILGCEFYLCPKSSTQKDNDNRKLSHLCVLAKNLDGWKSLIKATSFANNPDRMYYKPRLQLEEFSQFAGNFIAFSGHMGSDLANVIFADIKLAYSAKTYEDAKSLVKDNWKEEVINLAGKYREIFGKTNFFLEIQLIDACNLPAAQIVGKILRWLAKKEGYLCLATADSHYPTKEDAVDQRLVLCTAFETTLSAVKTKIDNNEDVGLGAFFRSNNYHIPSLEEIQQVNEPDEIANTVMVSEMCDVYNILKKNPDIPKFDCPNGINSDDYLKQLCREGWSRKIANKIPKEKHTEYADRVKYELGVLNGAKLADYFLIVKDYCDYARDEGMLMSPGRGSGAGCLVSNLLNITNLDPIEYGLMFERFYNAGRNTADRVSLPDIDCDFPPSGRAKIIQRMKDRFGHDKVSQMVTFSRMQGRGAMKDVLRAHEACSFEEMNLITKSIPDEADISDELEEMKQEFGESSIIQWALENNGDELKQWCYINKEGELEGQYSKLFAQAIRLEGTKRSQGKHAAGVVISPFVLSDVCPMVYDKKNDTMICGFEMGAMEKIGIAKFDILGVSTLQKIMSSIDILSEVRYPKS